MSDIVLRMHAVCNELVQLSKSLETQTDLIAADSDHVSLIRHFASVDDAYEQLNAAKKKLNAIHDRCSREYIPDALRKAGVKTVTIENLGRVTVAHRYSCSIINKDAGYKWLEDNGHGDLITQTVNSSTLAAFAKNLIVEEGKELPEEVFKTGTSPYTSITRAK